MRKAFIVFGGYNNRAVLAFCRFLTKYGINYHLIASDGNDPIYLTDYSERVFCRRNDRSLDRDAIRDLLLSVKAKFKYDALLIAPTSEFLNRFFLKHRECFEQGSIFIPLTDIDLYKKISDKESFCEMCRRYGIRVPRSFDSMPDSYPFVAKPRLYDEANASLAPHIINSDGDKNAFLSTHNESDFFYQEFIDGKSVYLLGFLGSRQQFVYSQRNLIQQGYGKSIILATHDDYHLKDDARRYLEMLASEGFAGLIMIEVRVCADGVSVMIEANPRLWGPLQFVVDNCEDILIGFCKFNGLSLDENIAPPHRQAEYYYWSGGTKKFMPPSFFNYDARRFMQDFHDISKCDIHLREDSINLYFSEY